MCRNRRGDTPGFVLVTLLLLAVTPAVQSFIPPESYFLDEDLTARMTFRFSDREGQSYEVVWPRGVTEQGLANATEGAFWSTVLFSQPIANPSKRREVYTNIFYAMAARPALTETMVDEYASVVREITRLEPELAQIEVAGLAYHVLAYGNLRYVKETGYVSRVLNDVKTAGRGARAVVQRPGFQRAAEALSFAGIALAAVDIATNIVAQTVLLTALSNDEAMHRLDLLRDQIQSSRMTDKVLALEGIAEAERRLERNQQWWNSFAEAVSEEAASILQLQVAVSAKALAHSAGVKLGAAVSLWALPVALGIKEYEEMTGVLDGVKEAMLTGHIVRQMKRQVDEGSAGREIADAVLYGQYHYYRQMLRTMEGMLARYAAMIWHDIAVIKTRYTERTPLAAQHLTAAAEWGQGGESELYVALVLDSSGSMASNDPHDIRKAGAKLIVDLLSPHDWLYIVDFDSHATWMNPDAWREWNPDEIKRLIERIGAAGGTDIGRALAAVRDALTQTHARGPGGVLLLSDGIGRYDGQAAWFERQGIPVYTVSLVGDENAEFLESIALQTGGEYIKARTADDVVLAFASFLARVRNRATVAVIRDSIDQGQEIDHAFYVDPSARSADALLSWRDNTVELALSGPDGTPYRQGERGRWTVGSRYVAVSIPDPDPGEWRAILYGADIPAGAEALTLEVTTDAPPLAGAHHEPRDDGSVALTVTADAERVARTVAVRFRVIAPDGTERPLAARTGPHEITFWPEAGAGTYTVELELEIVTAAGETARRHISRSVVVTEDLPMGEELFYRSGARD